MGQCCVFEKNFNIIYKHIVSTVFALNFKIQRRIVNSIYDFKRIGSLLCLTKVTVYSILLVIFFSVFIILFYFLEVI